MAVGRAFWGDNARDLLEFCAPKILPGTSKTIYNSTSFSSLINSSTSTNQKGKSFPRKQHQKKKVPFAERIHKAFCVWKPIKYKRNFHVFIGSLRNVFACLNLLLLRRSADVVDVVTRSRSEFRIFERTG